MAASEIRAIEPQNLIALEYATWQKELSMDLGERQDEFLIQVGYRNSAGAVKTTEPALADKPAFEAGE